MPTRPAPAALFTLQELEALVKSLLVSIPRQFHSGRLGIRDLEWPCGEGRLVNGSARHQEAEGSGMGLRKLVDVHDPGPGH